jgi:hypothetical protein
MNDQLSPFTPKAAASPTVLPIETQKPVKAAKAVNFKSSMPKLIRDFTPAARSKGTPTIMSPAAGI